MANITTAANFSLGVFAEHTVVRNNNPIAVTDPLARQIHFVPFCANGTSVLQPLLDFEQSPMGIGEMEPGVIYVTTSTPFDFESPKTLLRINMRGYTPGPAPPTPTSVLDFPREAIFLNGFAAASPSVLFVPTRGAGRNAHMSLSNERADGNEIALAVNRIVADIFRFFY